jgi:DNA processing protein
MASLALSSTLSKDDELHWLALAMVPGLGARKAGSIVQVFRTPQSIFRASRSELEAAGLTPAVAQSIASGCAFEDAVTQQQKVLETGTQVIPVIDPRYPPLLKDLYDAPPLLFARGRVELLRTRVLAMVGTRRPTNYGVTAAERLARDLSNAGLTIASGMARGIDTAAHRSVLECGGDTVAVFGCGVDEVYPAENRKLAARLIAEGLIISEFPMGKPPYPQNFPVRNRIISGMSLGVLVVEGSEYSGSAITAKLAAEQNREIFAVPGNITSRQSWGPNLLIKQGAKLVQEWSDVVGEFDVEDRQALADRFRNRLMAKEKTLVESSASESPSSGSGAIDPIRQSILRVLKTDTAVCLDELMEGIDGSSPSEILAAIFELELAGLVRQLPGKRFLRAWTG